MEIIKLPPGIQAPEESDCISVMEGADGRYYLNTSALTACAEEEDEAESSSTIGSAPYDRYDAAVAAGLALAAEQCVGTVYISRLKLEQA